MKLHEIINDTRGRMWCGPAAICAITGLPYGTVRTRLKELTGKRQITGMHHAEMEDALLEFGYLTPCAGYINFQGKDGKFVPVSKRPTVAQFLRERKKWYGADAMKRLILISAGGHFMLVKGIKFIDNHTQKPVFIREAHMRRARMKAAYIVERLEP